MWKERQNTMLNEIGSNFWINPNDLNKCNVDLDVSQFGIKCSDFVWLSSCRKAISLAIDNIEESVLNRRKTAILPSYTCESVIEPFVEHNYEVVFFPVNDNLEIDGEKLFLLCEKLPDAIMLIHRYFGFESLFNCNGLFSKIKALGLTIIEDRTQCLYSDLAPIEADYFVGSIRKWCGVPDGGFLASKTQAIQQKPSRNDAKLEKLKLKAELNKYEYIMKGIGEKQTFLTQFEEAEEILDNENEYFAISTSSKYIQGNLDINMLKEKRRENFLYLKRKINKETPLIDFKDFVTPLYFPIYVNNRTELQKKLRNNNIYAPIIWPKAKLIKTFSCEKMYKNMLCLPIDQRYEIDDMERMANVVNNYLE